jgi:MFS family permease
MTLSKPHSYRWVIVAAGALMTCIAIGAMFSLAVFLAPMSAATGWSRTDISAAMTLDFLVMGIAGFGWGALSDRIGPRVVVMAGAILLGIGLLIASQANTPLAFQLSFGGIVGLGAGAFFAPMIATVTGWFDAQRGLAVSLVSSGIGVAPMTVSPFAAWLIASHDWRTTMWVIAVGSLALLIPAALLVRSPPPTAAATIEVDAQTNDGGVARVGEAFKSPQFIVLGLTYFLCCAAHSGPIFHTMSYAQLCGVSMIAATTIYSIEGLAGLGGRLLLGIGADRYGVKRVLVVGLLVQSLAIAAYVITDELSEFYIVATIFGIAYGGVMPLYAVLAREYFGQSIMGTVFGAITMLSSMGMAFGPLAGGWIFDAFHAYRWLYLGSAAVAFGAFAIALTFPPRHLAAASA